MPHPLYALLSELEDSKIHFTLARDRSDTIRVTMHVVGGRVEIEVFDDGHMEVSRFQGSEAIAGDQELVQQIIRENRD